MGKAYTSFKKVKDGYQTTNYNQQANGIINPEELAEWLKQ